MNLKIPVNVQYSNIPASDDSTVPHVAAFLAHHIDQPCDPTWSIPQLGTKGAQLPYMETIQKMASSDW